jgi:hypothetical protein
MAGSAGHPDVESALAAAVGHGGTAYVAAGEVYQQLITGLSGSADTYDGTESAIIRYLQSEFQP